MKNHTEDVNKAEKDLMSEDEDAECQKQLSKRNLRKCLYLCCFAYMMNYSAYAGLIFLQSSVNIENGLGTTGLFLIYATSAFSTIFFVPIFIDFKGAKAAIVAGEIGILCYTLSNFYPSWYTIIPAALLHGLTESASWAGSSVYVTYLGEQYWERCQSNKPTPSASNKSKESYVYKFFCQFYTVVYFSQVLGNAVVSIVLTSLKDFNTPHENFTVTTATEPPSKILVQKVATLGNLTNTTSNTTLGEAVGVISDDTWEACGSMECQADFIYNADPERMRKYEPSRISIYLLLALFLLMQITFTMVHAIFLPRIPAKFGSNEHGRHSPVGQSENEFEKDQLVKDSASKRKITLKVAMVSELKETFRHMVSPLHLLVVPMVFYCGVLIAFNVAEFTRAYVSCTIGVEQIGIVMVAYGLTSMAVSGVLTQLLPHFGRNRLVFVSALLHLGTFLFCLFYSPSSQSPWMIYLNAVLLGACDGAIVNVIQGMIAIYFEDQLAIAFSVKNFGTNLGIVAGTGWSTILCVYVKLYILMGLLAFSCICYIFGEIWFQNKVKRSSADTAKAATQTQF
ncbi:protein unc-93 homolog A isoform X1 [Ciona intestinalis]